MVNNKTIYSKSLIETFDIAKSFAQKLCKNTVIGLIGNLGAGKTAFVKGAASGLGYDINKVSSPTFTIVNIYKTKIPIYHFDLYRIESVDGFETIGFYDYVDADGICFVEWVSNIGEDIKRDIDIKISIQEQNKRKIEFVFYNEKVNKFKDFV